MLNNFQNFIFEKKVFSLILENDLKASFDFLNRLRKIQDKSKVANLLSQIFSDELYIVKDLPQNWIDVTGDPEMISFLSDHRAKRTPMQWDEDESKFYETPGRGTIRIGRFAQALLTDPDVLDDIKSDNLYTDPAEFTPKDYEDFVNLYKSEHKDISRRFELVEGEEISKYYDLYNHAIPDKGQLGQSCMRFTSCQSYFKIYQSNPTVCRLLVYLNEEDKVLGRAIVWKLDKQIDGCPAEYFMDRVYCANDSDVIKFQNYANEQGWAMKAKNSSETVEGIFFLYKGQIYLSHITVKLEQSYFKKFPFLDTLSFLSTTSDKLHNIRGKRDKELTSTHGEYFDMLSSKSRKEYMIELLEEVLDDDYPNYKKLARKYLEKLTS